MPPCGMKAPSREASPRLAAERLGLKSAAIKADGGGGSASSSTSGALAPPPPAVWFAVHALLPQLIGGLSGEVVDGATRDCAGRVGEGSWSPGMAEKPYSIPELSQEGFGSPGRLVRIVGQHVTGVRPDTRALTLVRARLAIGTLIGVTVILILPCRRSGLCLRGDAWKRHTVLAGKPALWHGRDGILGYHRDSDRLALARGSRPVCLLLLRRRRRRRRRRAHRPLNRLKLVELLRRRRRRWRATHTPVDCELGRLPPTLSSWRPDLWPASALPSSALTLRPSSSPSSPPSPCSLTLPPPLTLPLPRERCCTSRGQPALLVARGALAALDEGEGHFHTRTPCHLNAALSQDR
eukprot:scaffold70697_cov29-Tisochrysis_lutea.AAC.1